MTAPDRLWIDTFFENDRAPDWPTKPVWKATEYVRADLSQAAVAAALQAAAGEVQTHADHWRKAWETAKSNSSPKEARDWQTMMLGGLFVKDSIRALITKPQHDALAAHVAAEVAGARAEEAAKIAQLEQDLADANSGAGDAYCRGYWEGGNGA